MEAVIVRKRCIYCGKDSETVVAKDKFDRWVAGEHVQDVWPEKTADEREMLISGTHPKCWDEMWGEEDGSS